MDCVGLDVLQLNKRYWPHRGGIERHVRDLAVGLAGKAAVRVSALVCNEATRREVKVVEGVEVDAVAGFGTVWSLPVAPGYVPALREHLARGVSVVHLHEPFPLGTVAWLMAGMPGSMRRSRGRILRFAQNDRGKGQNGEGKLSVSGVGGAGRTPLVVTWHSDIVRQRAVLPLYRPLIERVLAEASAVIVPTDRHISSSQFLPAVAEKCHVIPFGVDVGRFSASAAVRAGVELRREWGGQKVVLFVGRLVGYKGLPYLIRAMQAVDGLLVLVGDGRDRDALRRLAEECGAGGKVRFAGAVADEDLPAYYHACDVFVLPSVETSEGFGIVQLEAMAAGKPVVSTALPTGVATVNVDGKSGLVVPPAAERALAEAINRLLNRPDEAVALGRNGRRRVAERYSVEQMVEATLALYEEVSGVRGAGADT